MSTVTIRPARPDDLPRISEIETAAEATFAAYGQPLADSSPIASEDWREALAAGLLWVADDSESGPIGFLAAEVAEEALYLAEVDVLPQRQKQGHGRRLIETAIAQARSQRLTSVTLTTFRDIPWNAPFYATLGFVELAPTTASPHLAAALASQSARGLKGRCAMRLCL